MTALRYVRIQSIEDPLFAQMHTLMGRIFPKEEVLEFNLWKEPLEDPDIRVFVAVHGEEVVGATEYRFVESLNVAMTDFTIIGQPGLGIGRFLYKERERDLLQAAKEAGTSLIGMFAEIYDPYRVEDFSFGGVRPMDPVVRREVLSHLGYERLDFPYVHPSWSNDGEAVSGLDFCFMPMQDHRHDVPAELIVAFLQWYYAVLPNKPEAWYGMIEQLKQRDNVALLPL
ncbi:GNAT family N-acetyltransferase [Paenibacillus apiarius]|uniref:GNAT family N-acetyltransferase n=1 Tax=Paenibacillus apiarius TaxID=46240 RepID=A0ABT4DM87_9BACL|nr:GNAT family N-acetyltransferase [Paenibacillus apiarius]MBN3526296.1 GNAT family N-acetyltransferase [Paenibacillus apiarius]MCY9516069.1 GNAT family N-acetyltransferase [Paenibacillus apiarius]MCY9518472.1 GNAT family N-acetyltransferase [Paenibacillus apiarius]MCY9551127.1 GNAT family N-acetyltransferase [Paenibacillus apiarius]MCY9558281.1 GNAT family N-acetyltransferase [Paenibacillus apiarius]